MYKLIFILFFGLCSNFSEAQPNYSAWDSFLKKYVSSSGDVDYKSIKSNKKELDAITKSFSAVKELSTWPKNDQLSFWINTYNAYTIDLIVRNYPIKSIQTLDGGKPWDVKRIKIEGKIYSLNNIENDIIRPQYKDARIHFAVNCGAKSCPPLLNSAFVGKTLDDQLNTQTKAFINNQKYQKLGVKSASISKIFDWYVKDFGNIISFINKYSKTKLSSKARISYMEYDWSLNSSL